MPRIMCHNHEISEKDRSFIEEKVGKLKKYFDRITEVSVILDETKTTHQAEILAYGPQMSLRFRQEAGDMRTAFEGALNKAEQGLHKTKTKRWGDKMKGRNSVTIRRFNPMDFETEGSAPAPKANNGFHLSEEALEPKPMSIEEAHLQLKARNTGLLVFINSKTDKVNILHRNAHNEVEQVEFDGDEITDQDIIGAHLA
jgi:putative sigma-54 modulation protein